MSMKIITSIRPAVNRMTQTGQRTAERKARENRLESESMAVGVVSFK